MDATSPATKPILSARNLSKRLAESGRTLFEGLDFHLSAGERVAIIGPSGSGKSTLLRILAMLDVADSGEIIFDGQKVQAADVPQYRRTVAYVAQRPAFIPGTVRSNLRLPFELNASTEAYDETAATELLGSLQRDASFLDQDTSGLSGGERQIVSITRALMLSPRALLLDEPTAALDATISLQVERLIESWHARSPRHACLWVSHDEGQIARVVDRLFQVTPGSPRQ